MPRTLAQQITARAAPVLTELARETFAESENAYGDPWLSGKEGEKVSLVKTGRLREQLFYVAIGTRLRVALGVRYAKYQIGKRRVFPRQGALPEAYVRALTEIAQEAAREELGP
ncbi:MAG: hypothetical protein FWD69_10490 [Polyangiaceae bacterium]|nr:hypothetical protein [Polyangiaceae bacterium]